ncbi:MAG: transposase, partial [Lysobacterales bacterium]
MQQLREAVGYEYRYRYLIHDRDSIFAKDLHELIERLGLKVLKSPPRSPMANAICERVLGTLRQECLDLMIPLTEPHLRHIVREWVRHYNAGRPHMSLGPGIPQPLASLPVPVQRCRHRLPEHLEVVAYPILGGLHHD